MGHPMTEVAWPEVQRIAMKSGTRKEERPLLQLHKMCVANFYTHIIEENDPTRGCSWTLLIGPTMHSCSSSPSASRQLALQEHHLACLLQFGVEAMLALHALLQRNKAAALGWWREGLVAGTSLVGS